MGWSAISLEGGAGSGDGLTWSTLTTNATLAADHGYYINSAGLLTVTLPATMAQDQRIKLIDINTGGFVLAQQAGQSIVFEAVTTTVGVGGSLASTTTGQVLEIQCKVADTGFQVLDAVGAFTIV